jgi:hypothetical protein
MKQREVDKLKQQMRRLYIDYKSTTATKSNIYRNLIRPMTLDTMPALPAELLHEIMPYIEGSQLLEMATVRNCWPVVTLGRKQLHLVIGLKIAIQQVIPELRVELTYHVEISAVPRLDAEN